MSRHKKLVTAAKAFVILKTKWNAGKDKLKWKKRLLEICKEKVKSRNNLLRTIPLEHWDLFAKRLAYDPKVGNLSNKKNLPKPPGNRASAADKRIKSVVAAAAASMGLAISDNSGDSPLEAAAPGLSRNRDDEIMTEMLEGLKESRLFMRTALEAVTAMAGNCQRPPVGHHQQLPCSPPHGDACYPCQPLPGGEPQ
jgi:hypothetical protein